MPESTDDHRHVCDWARRGRLKKLRIFFRENKNANVNYQDANGVSALIAACTTAKNTYRPHRTHPKTVKYLLAHKADVSQVDNLGYTALHEACRSGDVELCKILVNAGASATTKSLYGERPLDLVPQGTTNANSIKLLFEEKLADSSAESKNDSATPSQHTTPNKSPTKQGRKKKKKRAKKKTGASYKPSSETCHFEREILDLELPRLDGAMDEEDLEEYRELCQEEADEGVNSELAEKYIPVVVMELIQKLVNLATDAGIAEGETRRLEKVFRLLCYHIQVSLTDEAQEISRNYAEFQEDRDTVDIIADSKSGIAEMRKLFLMDFKQYVLNANFKVRSHAWVESKVGAKSEGGMQVRVKYDVFYQRGDGSGNSHGKPDYTIFTRGEYLKEKKSEPFGIPLLHHILGWRKTKVSHFKRLLIMYRLADPPVKSSGWFFGSKQTPQNPENCKSGYTYLKLFRDFPEDDIEMIMPGSSPVLTIAAWCIILTPILSGLAAMGSRIPGLSSASASSGNTTNTTTGSVSDGAPDASSLAAAQRALVEFILLLSATASYFLKSYTQYKKQQAAFRVKLNGILYDKLLSTNGSCVAQLHKEAGAQEQRESILAYFFLLYKLALPEKPTAHLALLAADGTVVAARDSPNINSTKINPPDINSLDINSAKGLVVTPASPLDIYYEKLRDDPVVVTRRSIGEAVATGEIDDMVEALMMKMKLSNKDPIDFDVRDALEGLIRNGLVKKYTAASFETALAVEDKKLRYVEEEARKKVNIYNTKIALAEKALPPPLQKLKRAYKRLTFLHGQIAKTSKVQPLVGQDPTKAAFPPGEQYTIECHVKNQFGIKFKNYYEFQGVGVEVEAVIEGGKVAERFPKVRPGHVLVQVNEHVVDPTKTFKDVMRFLREEERPLMMKFVIVNEAKLEAFRAAAAEAAVNGEAEIEEKSGDTAGGEANKEVDKEAETKEVDTKEAVDKEVETKEADSTESVNKESLNREVDNKNADTKETVEESTTDLAKTTKTDGADAIKSGKEALEKALCSIPHKNDDGETIAWTTEDLLQHDKKDLLVHFARIKDSADGKRLRRERLKSFRAESKLIPYQPSLAFKLMTAKWMVRVHRDEAATKGLMERLATALSSAPAEVGEDEDRYDAQVIAAILNELTTEK